ncbi:glycosyltransferase [Sulfobacillus harzensis]|uniref:Glycosyltransferase family 4 protein n=1 Tax=Sulfobacillus harzensis TaxID=2729629 RepID=A0A7Y0L2F2_9FIRM|nr:glycosyltransferase [Sulfobacillus harzensis]NMP21772.1 glycosyltransferase family 4 protein [Sulfobacillus harzensis]
MIVRVALVIPNDTPPTGGNSISARRMKKGLEDAGHEADVIWYHDGIGEYDVYHAWNAVRVGGQLVEDGINPEQIVATWTGTDLWKDWVQNAAQEKRRLERIRYQVTFTEDARARILADAPEWEDRVVVIPPSVDIDHFCPEDTAVEVPHPFVLVAGGVRPVKRSAWAIDLVAAYRERTGADVHLAIAGPVRETGEWQRVQEKAEGKDWVQLPGDLPPEEMPKWYRAADVFLNTSEVEGVSNAIMEAMGCGALVVATDIQGNRALIQPGRTGLLFKDEEEFLVELDRALHQTEESERIRRAARQQIVARHSIQYEAKRYERLYLDAISVRGCCR